MTGYLTRITNHRLQVSSPYYLKFILPSFLYCRDIANSLRFSVCLNQLTAELNKRCVPDPVLENRQI